MRYKSPTPEQRAYARWITPSGIAKELGVSKQRASQIMREQGFDRVVIGPNHVLISRADFNRYVRARRRTALAKKAGRTSNRLLHNISYDCECPLCGAPAVDWNQTKVCVNGHIIPWGSDIPRDSTISKGE